MKLLLLILLVIAIVIASKLSKTKNSHKTFTEKDEKSKKNKENLKEKIKNDLEKNKIDHVFISKYSKKYHYKGCRYCNEITMKKISVDIANRNGYKSCKVCAPKK